MRQNAVRRGQDNVTELTTGQQVDDPFLNFAVFDIEARADDTALVQAARQFNHNLVGSVIIDNFEFTNISCKLECHRSYGKSKERENKTFVSVILSVNLTMILGRENSIFAQKDAKKKESPWGPG